ncbi:MAG: M36 family metallopeptidase, partial [Bacteroidetes bacterium]|nr:M36 family metallopeptidase [Bacteroidota bacterium]
MKIKSAKYKIATLLIILLCSSLAQAQNLGSYVYPYPSFKLPSGQWNISSFSKEKIEQEFNRLGYNNISLELIYTKESLGTSNLSYQVSYKNALIHFGLVKLHFDLSTGKLLLFQANLPPLDDWMKIHLEASEDYHLEILFENKIPLIARKINLIEEARDYYATRFILNSGAYYENDTKFHKDSTAYVKVFLPDPLSSSEKNYGGAYQDAYTKDTSAIFVQNVPNNGNPVLNTPSAQLTIYGQSFNVSAESYGNTFSQPNLFQVLENLYLSSQLVVLGYTSILVEDLNSFSTQIIIEDYNYPELEAEQSWQSMDLSYESGEFLLQSPYFILSEFSPPFTNQTSSLNDSLGFNRSQVEFEDVNAFFHLDNFRKYWQSLGFTQLDDEVILVDAHGNSGADNSFFTPTSPPRLVFGQGGVDDAEDADVVVHEYGHALSNFASPGTNSGDERRAIDEGFGDYLASSYSAKYSSYFPENVFSWDGHNEFWSGRTSNSTKTKEDINLNENIYYNGEIWSSTLMDLHALIGAEACDKLAIEVMYYNMPNQSIAEIANNLFLADSVLFNGDNYCDIFNVLSNRKFVDGYCYGNGFNEDAGALLLNSSSFSLEQG